MSRIYHYTSASSLIGILTHGQFWATDIAFLNDQKEHVYGFNAAISFIDEKINTVDAPYRVELINFYNVLRDAIEPNVLGRDTYIISFAKEKDSISHWFSYCEKNQGYCICFEEEDFFVSSEKLELSSVYALKFEDVIYDSLGFHERLEKILSKEVVIETIRRGLASVAFDDSPVATKKPGKSSILDSINREPSFQEATMEQIGKIFNEIIFSSGAFKFEGFKHEVERRLVLSCKKGRFDSSYDYSSTTVQFRERGGVIFPYVPVRFNKRSIREIVIGPSGDFELRKAGLQKLLDKMGVVCEVTSSATPLRFS
ncbi:hypothetical protein [Pseudomonas sp.]|uniref:hypothetical protein n=1 Tax=Pseudomonas sp. TaxID=306 RepID=UPI003A981474